MFSAEDRTARQGLFQRIGLASVAAAAAAGGGFAAAHASGQELLVQGRDGWTPVPLGAVLAATLVGALAAYVLARMAARTSRPRMVFGALVAAGLLASSVPALAAARDRVTSVWLLALHVVVAAVLVPAVLTVLPPRRTRAAAPISSASAAEASAGVVTSASTSERLGLGIRP